MNQLLKLRLFESKQLLTVAVTVGFEPTVGFHPHNFSRVAPSAARTRHRQTGYRISTTPLELQLIPYL